MSGPYDVAIIGAGIAGACAAHALAPRRSVLMLERESQPGYHTTGRSAALFIESYGNAPMRALTVAGAPFLRSPPPGFTAHPILTPRGVLMVGSEDQRESLRTTYEDGRALTPTIRSLDADEVRALCPVLRPEHAVAGVLEPDATAIDVHALHQGYLRGARAHGATLVTDAEVRALDRTAEGWRIATSAGEFRAAIVIDAAGAWADAIAALAGIAPIGLVPKRRTALTFDPPAGLDVNAWPAVANVDYRWYIKPDAGRILASPADATPMPPCDVQPDEMDLALCVERIEQATTLPVRRLVSKWAGLRSFVADETIVIGPDPAEPRFFWLAGQGGHGIQTSAGAGAAVAALVESGDLPAGQRALGLTRDALGVARLRRNI